jgi:hypothetical protein
MKQVASWIGALMLFAHAILTVLFWAAAYGAVGFFGSILTIPISMLFFVILTLIGNVFAGFVMIAYIVIAVLLISIGSED